MGYAGLKPIDPITFDPSTSKKRHPRRVDPQSTAGPGWIMTSGRHHAWSCPRYSSSSVAWLEDGGGDWLLLGVRGIHISNTVYSIFLWHPQIMVSNKYVFFQHHPLSWDIIAKNSDSQSHTDISRETNTLYVLTVLLSAMWFTISGRLDVCVQLFFSRSLLFTANSLDICFS